MHCILSLGSPNHVETSERSGALATSWRRLEFPDNLKFEEDSGPKLQLARLSDSVILALAVLVAAARGGQFLKWRRHVWPWVLRCCTTGPEGATAEVSAWGTS